MIHIGRLLIQLYTHYFKQTLITLSLSTNEIEDVEAQHLAVGLRNNTVTFMLSLSMSYTNLHFFTQTLITLDLSSNYIRAVGAEHLADALRNNTVTVILCSSVS
jgi:hypothetical protein